MSRILIVDDEPHYGDYLGDWLSCQGHEVKTATTAHDAIDCVAAWRPHVLVADWMLKNSLDGLQVSAAVREAIPEVQTILITAYPSPELRARAEDAQVFRFLEKPFSLEDIAGTVSKAVHESQRMRASRLLLVSDTVVVRKATVDMLQSAGWICHVADSHAIARNAIERDPKIAVAILDCLEPASELGLLAAELRAIRPGLTIVGCSERAADKHRFADLGIADFVPRFWEVADLVKLLAAPIANCVECDLPLPLLRATLRDDAASWECSMCGSRYRAVLGDDAPEELRRNVRLAT